jgi:hypothetical protein
VSVVRLPLYACLFRSCLIAVVLFVFHPTIADAQMEGKSGDLPLPPLDSGALPQRIVISGRHAYQLGDPEMLAGPSVIWASISPSGDALLAIRKRSPGNITVPLPKNEEPDGALDAELFYWNRHTGRTVSLWRRNLRGERLNFARSVWLADGTHAVVCITRSVPDATGKQVKETDAVVVDTLNARARVTSLGPGGVGLSSNPNRALAAITVFNLPPRVPGATVQTIDTEGRLSAPVAVPRFGAGGTMIAGGFWDGDKLNVTVAEQYLEDGKQMNVAGSQRAEMKNGTLRFLTAEEVKAEEKTKPTTTPVSLMTDEALSLGLEKDKEKTGSGHALWLVAAVPDKETPAALQRVCVALETDQGWLLPGLSGILYTSRGGLYLVPLTRSPLP